jgi:uncharacterized protein with HEPN domain
LSRRNICTTSPGLADLIRRFTKGKAFADFEGDEMMRSAVERQFEIIGEALNKLARADAETAARISEYHHIIAFRNILIHGYAEIDRRLVRGVVESKLGVLTDEVNALVKGSRSRSL